MPVQPVTWLRTRAGAARRSAGILRRRPHVGVYKWVDANPYQRLLYGQFRAQSAPVGLRQPYELGAFSRLPPRGRLLHLHWEGSYTWSAAGPARDALHGAMRRSLERWTRRNGRLAWTLHNADFHSEEENTRMGVLQRFLGDAADVVHVHSQAAARHAVGALGVDPAKVLIIEHPSYVTLYPDDAAEERTEPQEGWRLLLFGAIKGYKSYDGLADALERLPGGAFASLCIAGSGSLDDVPVRRLRAILPVDLDLRHVPESEVPALFNRADFLVLPYTRSLTSGAALLGMGFGVPVIGPRLGGMREAVPVEGAPLLYDPAEPAGLAEALGRASAMTREDHARMRAACLRRAAELHPDRTSIQLRDALHARGLLPA